MNFSIFHNGLNYQGIDFETLQSLVGEQQATAIARQDVIKKVKAASAAELAQYDWMFIREYRMANTNTPAPVAAEVLHHYEVVRTWVEQQEQLIHTLSAEACVDHQFVVPVML